MWAWNMIRGTPKVHSATVTGIGGSSSMSSYGGDAAMADMRAGAEQRRARRHRRRRRARQTTVGLYAAQRRSYRSRKTVHRRRASLKTRVVGVRASTGKRIYQGKSGGRYTRGARGSKNYF